MFTFRGAQKFIEGQKIFENPCFPHHSPMCVLDLNTSPPSPSSFLLPPAYSSYLICCIVVLLYCTIVLQHDCTLVLLYDCTIALLYYCTTVLVYYCAIVLLHYSTIVLLYYCTRDHRKRNHGKRNPKSPDPLLYYCTRETTGNDGTTENQIPNLRLRYLFS